MLSFEKRFTNTLVTEAKAPKELPLTDKEAFESQLEPTTNPQAFDVKPNPQINYKVQVTNSQLKELQNWINEIDTWKEKLNGLGPDSIQSKLNSAECETVFTPIARSETKKISRIAQELGSLVESLKGHLMSADTTI